MKYAIDLTPGRRPGDSLNVALQLARDEQQSGQTGTGILRDLGVPVLSCNGLPAVGATVRLGSLVAIADANGIAHFVVAPGTYPITVSGLFTPAVPAIPGTPAGDFFSDTFTGSGILTGHTSDSGHSWADAKVDQSVSDPNSSLLTGGKLRSQSPNWWFGAIASAVPPSANYYVEAACHISNPATSNGNLVLAGRWDEAGLGTGYYVTCFRNSIGNLQGFLRRRNGGGINDDAWGFGVGVAVLDDFTLRLDMTGPNIVVSVNGSPQITRDETGVSLTTQVGRIALHIDANLTDQADYSFDSIVSHTPGTPGVPGTPASGCPDYTTTLTVL